MKKSHHIDCGEILVFQNGEDGTPIKLFIAGVRGWEIAMRRAIHNMKTI